MDYAEIDARMIDRWVTEGWVWGKPTSHEMFCAACQGIWDVLLTPTKPVPHAWLGNLRGKKILGLAAGGGRQMPIFVALGAECTVLDYSEEQLQLEADAANRERYILRILKAEADKPLPVETGYFDIIFYPASDACVGDKRLLWRECSRVLKSGGVLLAGADNGMNGVFDETGTVLENSLSCFPMEEHLGGQLEAGFVLTHLYEDTNGEGNLRERNIPSYIATRAVKPGRPNRPAPPPKDGSAQTVKFTFRREPAYNGMGVPYAMYINGVSVGGVKNGQSLTAEGPLSRAYLLEKDGPFGTAVILRGKGRECALTLRTTGGYGAPNGQDAVARTAFLLGDRELQEPAVYGKIRAARLDPEVRASLTEWERPLFVCSAFWRAFGKALERENEVTFGAGMDGALEALETVGAKQTAAFCRSVMGESLAPGKYPLPENRPDIRKDIIRAVHVYILKKEVE